MAKARCEHGNNEEREQSFLSWEATRHIVWKCAAVFVKVVRIIPGHAIRSAQYNTQVTSTLFCMTLFNKYSLLP